MNSRRSAAFLHLQQLCSGFGGPHWVMHTKVRRSQLRWLVVWRHPVVTGQNMFAGEGGSACVPLTRCATSSTDRRCSRTDLPSIQMVFGLDGSSGFRWPRNETSSSRSIPTSTGVQNWHASNTVRVQVGRKVVAAEPAALKSVLARNPHLVHL